MCDIKVGRTPWSAAGPLAGLAGRGRPARTRGSAPLSHTPHTDTTNNSRGMRVYCATGRTSMADILWEPLRFRNLTVKNRIFRSNISGRFDNYDGSGNQARINWETKFARGGVGAIVSSFVPVHLHGRIMPG